MIGLIDNPDPPAEPIEREYNDAEWLFQSDEQVLERIERIERLERSTMTDIETDLMLARAEIATLKADLAALTARAAKAEQERDRAIEDLSTTRSCVSCDAVPVVFCRECMYRQKAKVNRKGFLICPASGMEITDDDYCSYGAKMEDKP